MKQLPIHISKEVLEICGEAELSAPGLRYENNCLDYYRYDSSDFEYMRTLVSKWATRSPYPTNIVLGVANTVIDELEQDVQNRFSEHQ